MVSISAFVVNEAFKEILVNCLTKCFHLEQSETKFIKDVMLLYRHPLCPGLCDRERLATQLSAYVDNMVRLVESEQLSTVCWENYILKHSIEYYVLMKVKQIVCKLAAATLVIVWFNRSEDFSCMDQQWKANESLI